MVNRIPSGFRFEQGVISVTQSEKDPHLPSLTPLAPGAEQPARSKVADILYGESLGEALASYFRPIPADPSLTEKTRYRFLLRHAIKEFNKAGETHKNERALCFKAAALLEQLGDIHDELNRRRTQT